MARPVVRLAALVTLAAAAATGDAGAGEVSAPEAYAALSRLAGHWQGTTHAGRSFGVTFRPTAAGSALVETWTLGNGRESMTVYALDGSRLLATHYCPQGNQPRLVYRGADADGRLQFEFLDGGNLHVPGRSHQQAFWIALDGNAAFVRSETYVENDSDGGPPDAGEAVRFQRVD